MPMPITHNRLHVVIKLLSTTVLVLAPLFIGAPAPEGGAIAGGDIADLF